MEKEVNEVISGYITLNNGNAVVEKLASQGDKHEDVFFTVVQGNSFGGVHLSDENIHDNSKYIADLWD